MPGRRSYERSNSNGEDDYADDFENPSEDENPATGKPSSSSTSQNGSKHLKSSTQTESINDSGHSRIIESNSNQSRRDSNHSTSTGRPKSKRRSALWIQEGKWSLGECIGKGSFGDVFQCMNDKGKLYASKRVEISTGCRREELDDMVREIEFMRDLCHPNIVEYIGATVDENRGHLYIFQEWVSGGSLAHLLKRFGPFQEGVVQNYTRQVLFGLDYLHHHHIVHRDIKGGNILVDESGTVKLADFGASTKLIQAGGDDASFYQTQELLEIKGTPYFMAPEVLSENKYGRKGDIWAVGCTMFQMLTGEPPWKDRNLAGLIQLHVLLQSWPGGPPPMPVGRSDNLSIELKKCLNMCFQKNVHDRPTPEKLLECEFFASLNNDNLEESSTYDNYGSSPDEKSYAMNQYHNNHNSSSSSNHNRPNSSGSGLGREYLEDSGVISGLRAKMERVMSTALLPPTHHTNNNNNNNNNNGGNNNNNNAYSNQSSPDQINRKPNLFHPTPSPVYASQQQHVGMINIRRSHEQQQQQPLSNNAYANSNDIRKTSPEQQQQQQQQQYNLQRVPSDSSNSPSQATTTTTSTSAAGSAGTTPNARVKNPFGRSREGQPAYSPSKGLQPNESQQQQQQGNSSNGIGNSKHITNAATTPSSSSSSSLRSFSTDTAEEKEQKDKYDRDFKTATATATAAINSSGNSSSSSSVKTLSQRERLQQQQLNSNQISAPVTNNASSSSSSSSISPRGSDMLQSCTDQRLQQQQQQQVSQSRSGRRGGLASHAVLSNERINSTTNDNDNSNYDEKNNRERDNSNSNSSSRGTSGGSVRIHSSGTQNQSRLLPPHSFEDEFNTSPRSVGSAGSVTRSGSSTAHTTPAADSFRVVTTHTPIGSPSFMNDNNNNNSNTNYQDHNSNNHSNNHNRFFATTEDEAVIVGKNNYKINNTSNSSNSNSNNNYSFNHTTDDRPLQSSQRSQRQSNDRPQSTYDTPAHWLAATDANITNTTINDSNSINNSGKSRQPPATAPETYSSSSSSSQSRISRQQQQQQQQSSSSLLSSSARSQQSQSSSATTSSGVTHSSGSASGSGVKQRPSQLRDSHSTGALNNNKNANISSNSSATVKPSTASASTTSTRISSSRRPISTSNDSSRLHSQPLQQQQAWGSNNNDVNDGDNDEWKCLKCNRSNNTTLHYCDGCATVRGATGRRDNTAGLHRL